MKLHGDTNANLADGIGISPQRLSAKINTTNGAEFTQGEIHAIKDRYALTDVEVNEIFFDQVWKKHPTMNWMPRKLQHSDYITRKVGFTNDKRL